MWYFEIGEYLYSLLAHLKIRLPPNFFVPAKFLGGSFTARYNAGKNVDKFKLQIFRINIKIKNGDRGMGL